MFKKATTDFDTYLWSKVHREKNFSYLIIKNARIWVKLKKLSDDGCIYTAETSITIYGLSWTNVLFHLSATNKKIILVTVPV